MWRFAHSGRDRRIAAKRLVWASATLAASARELHDLSWGKWAGRVDEYLRHLEALLSPQLFIVGGGISKKADKFLPLLTSLRARVVPAGMLNDAGIVGAAMAGAEMATGRTAGKPPSADRVTGAGEG